VWKLFVDKSQKGVTPAIKGDQEASERGLSRTIAEAMAADAPDRCVAKITKSLRKGKILVDYLRNSLEQTSVALYSARARKGAPVSVPVTWQELGRTTAGDQYTVLNLMKRLTGRKRDPWQDIGRLRQKLPRLRPAGD
jgi:bifunctional non-homologous end joining protein LigD